MNRQVSILYMLAGIIFAVCLFITIAFIGVFPDVIILGMIVTQVFIKTAYEIIILLFTILVVNQIKSIEGIDTFDQSISYNPFRINQI